MNEVTKALDNAEDSIDALMNFVKALQMEGDAVTKSDALFLSRLAEEVQKKVNKVWWDANE